MIFITASIAYLGINAVIPEKAMKSVSYENISYDSKSSNPKIRRFKEFNENEDKTWKDVRISFKLKFYDTANYANIFQTSNWNQGIRMEVSPAGELNLVINDSTESGCKGYKIAGPVSLNEWHPITVEISKNKRIRIAYDRKIIFTKIDNAVKLSISNIAVGTGFSKTRPLNGAVSSFSIQYRLYDVLSFRNILSNYFILAVLMCFLFYIYKPKPVFVRFSEDKESVYNFVADTFAIAVFIILAVILIAAVAKYYKPGPNNANFSLLTDTCRSLLVPEPVERKQFVLSVLFAPIFAMIAFTASRRIIRVKGQKLAVAYGITFILGTIFIITVLRISFRNGMIYFGESLFYLNPFILFPAAAVLAVLVFLSERYAITGIIIEAASAVALLFMASFFVFTHDNYPGWIGHFDAAFYSVSQVVHGKTLLIDFLNQYGLYPHFLEPIFRITGLTVLRYSIIMSLLISLSYYFIYRSLKRVITNRMIAFLGLLAILYSQIQPRVTAGFDAYFQSIPIRLLFPTLSLFLISDYLKNKSFKKYVVIVAALSAGVFWNFDSGLIAFIAVFLTLLFEKVIYAEKKRILKEIVKHISITALIFTLLFALLNLFLFIRTGHLPDFKQVVAYQKLYYVTGLMMMPMPVFHAWNIVILIYVIGLINSVKILFNKISRTSENFFILYLTLLGIGIFSYYQGRSHELNLYHVAYPALMLLAIYAGRLWQSLKESSAFLPDKAFIFSIILIIFTLPVLAVYEKNSLLTKFTDRAISSIKHKNCQFEDWVSFIKKYTRCGENVFITSYVTGTLYAESQTISAVNVPSNFEMVLQKDLNVIDSFIVNDVKTKFFVDSNYPIYLNTLTSPVLLNVFDTTSDKRFIYAEKAVLYRETPAGAGIILNATFPADIMSNPKVIFPNIVFGKEFRIEISVLPLSYLAKDSCILSNYYGVPGQDGIIISKDNDNDNRYNFSVGNGAAIEYIATLNLIPERFNKISIKYKDGSLSIKINDSKERKFKLKAPLIHSNLPLWLGNSAAQTKPFNGLIKDIKISY